MLFLYASASVYWLCCFEVIVNCCNGSYLFFFFFNSVAFWCACVCVFCACAFSISISSKQNVGWVHYDSVTGVSLMYRCVFVFFLVFILKLFFRYRTVFCNSSYCTTSAFFLKTSG